MSEIGGKRSAESIYICGFGKYFGILGYRNVSPTDYVKRPRRSVAVEANKVENAEWQCLAVAQIRLPAVAWIGVVDMDKDCEMVASRLLDRWKGG